MEFSWITLIIAVIAIFVVWKVFAGIVKTIALLVIAGVAAVFVFGGFA